MCRSITQLILICMKREELEKGVLLRKGTAADSTMTIAFHEVILAEEVVGVGLYHGDNDECTVAMIKDFKGNPLGQEESAGYPTTQEELDELDTCFHDFLRKDK